MKEIDCRILKKIKEQKDGINFNLLSDGTILKIGTVNSVYTFKKEGDDVIVEGGKYFPEPTKTWFSGSTFGGSMLKMKWIGKDMHMELGHPTKPGNCITTSAVKKAKIISDNWEYELDW